MKNTLTTFLSLAVILGIPFLSLAAMPDVSLLGPRTEGVDLNSFQHVYYVSAAAGDDEQGDGSRDKPWKSVVHALACVDSAGADNPCALLVAEGLYDQATVVMKPYVSLFGGFSKDTWDRDIDKWQSVLSGAEVRRVVAGADNARLDGFHVTGGRAAGHGAGILCDDASPAISNNVITGNRTLEPPDFKTQRIHQRGYEGGGVACLYNAHPVISNNLIVDNATGVGNGGGVAFHGWIRPKSIPPATFTRNIVVGNTSGGSERSQTRCSSGGGIACAYEATPRIEENVVACNRARGLSDTGGIFCEYAACPTISRNWVVGNWGDDDGGGIYVMRVSEPVIEGNIVAGNASRGVGGIRISKEGRAIINGNLVARNLSGGGVLVRDGYVSMTKNLVVDNLGGVGFEYKQDYKYFVGPQLEDNVIWGNEQPGLSVVVKEGPPPTVRNCVIEGGFDGEGNSAADPNVVKDGGQGTLSSLSYSPETFTTKLAGQIPDCATPGRVLFLGKQASVVKSREDGAVTVWGRLSRDEDGRPLDTFDIMSTYGF